VIYHISDNDLLQKIQRYILNIKPKTYTDFQDAVQKRADALSLTISQADIQAFARHLREQNHIRQNNGKIEYAPFPHTNPNPISQKKILHLPDETMWKKVIAALSVEPSKRPGKVSTLRNTIKAHAKSNNHETEKLLQHLLNRKVLSIDGTNITYLK